MNKPKICLCLVGKLPVPATMGGAVEFLAEALIEENEKHQFFDLTVLSIAEPEACKKAARYPNTHFVWFRHYPVWNKVWWRVYSAEKKLLGKEICFPYQRVKAAEWLKEHRNAFDYFLAESELEMFISAGIDSRRVLYHLHWEGAPTEARDHAFSHLMPVSADIGRGWCEKTGRAPETVYPLLNCTDISAFRQKLSPEEKAAFKAGLGIDKDAFTVVFAGRLVPVKGARELVKAVSELHEGKIDLIVVGSTNFAIQEQSDYIRQMQELAAQSKNKIVFTGFVPHDELWRYFSASDVLVSPSQCRDAAGIVNIEAMASGLPVICTRVGGIPEYVSKECGLFVEWDDHLVESLKNAILQLYHDPDLREQMGRNGMQQAGQFGIEAYYEHFCDIIRRLSF